MDKIDKSLLKIAPRQRLVILKTLQKIHGNELDNLDLKKLKGTKDIFRVRAGSFRIIFKLETDSKPKIIAIERRSEKTYKGF